MKILAIIPARSGSKGLKSKNIKKINNKTLLEYSIRSAQESKKIDKIIVSTDSEKFKNIAKKIGVEVPFLRPKKYSTSKSNGIDYIKHTLNYLKEKENYEPEIIVILQPTSPIRYDGLIDKSINMLKKSKGTSVIGVSIIKQHPFSAYIPKGEFLTSYKKNSSEYYQRQKFPKMYYPTGSIYTFWNKTFEKFDSPLGNKIIPLVLEPEFSIDIDNLFDFFQCEMTIKYWNKYKKLN
jgi:CMP-N,N'-diacetyllegionaminic acid synthase